MESPPACNQESVQPNNSTKSPRPESGGDRTPGQTADFHNDQGHSSPLSSLSPGPFSPRSMDQGQGRVGVGSQETGPGTSFPIPEVKGQRPRHVLGRLTSNLTQRSDLDQPSQTSSSPTSSPANVKATGKPLFDPLHLVKAPTRPRSMPCSPHCSRRACSINGPDGVLYVISGESMGNLVYPIHYDSSPVLQNFLNVQ